MELTALETARDFTSYLERDEIKEALETLPDTIRQFIISFAETNEQNLDEISSVVGDACFELQEAQSRMESVASEADDAANGAGSALNELERLS